MMETTHGRAFTFFPPPQNTDYFLCRGAACWSPSPPPSAAEGWRAARSWGGRAAVSRRASARPPPHPPGWVFLGGHGRLGDPGGQEGADDGGAQPWPGRGSERSDGVGSTFSVGEVLELPSRRICSRISKSTADSLCPGDPRGGEGCAQGPPHQQLCLLSFPISAINDITAYFQGSRAWDGDPE